MDYFKLLEEISNTRENKDFLVINEKKYTYSEIYKISKLLGEKINNIVKVNECSNMKNKLLIYSDNFYFQLIAFFASNFAKGIPVISHYNLPKETLNKIIINNEIQYVITDTELKLNEYNINFREVLEGFEKVLLYKTNTKRSDIINTKICIGVLTSGSTGIPKVLYRTYESWVDFFGIQNKVFKINLNSKLFVNGALSFTGNLNAIMSILYEGGTVVSITGFNCKRWLKAINTERVTNIYLVPTKLKMLNSFVKEPINNVKSIFTGSQLLFESTADELRKKFVNSEIILYYGASELNYITYINYEEIHSKPLSVGRPFHDVEIFIENDYIYVNTKYQVEGMKSPCTVYDVGYIDEDGYLIFDGRKDNVINKGGIKISGTKIENEIRKINEVSDVAVIGYNHNKKGNEISAYIVLNKEITKADIIQKLKSSLMDIEIPKKIIFVDDIPLNNSGKVDRIKLAYNN
jgi:long-chain acyl-CoA synthetase